MNLLLLLLLLLAVAFIPIGESFFDYPGSGRVWQSTRFTRNQSYDLRGDPIVIAPPYPGYIPWNVSSWAYF